MKRHWIAYTPARTRSPMTYWVHVEADGKPWYQAQSFDPPLPKVIGGKGYPLYFVEIGSFTFQFSSLVEVRACINVLAQKHLPTTIKLSQGRGTGPNGHWLSRLPKEVKSWRYRERAVTYLHKALADFEREVGESP